MKKLLLLFSVIWISFTVATDRDLHRIQRLVEPYEQAIDFIINLDPARKVSDHDVFVFFSRNDLYEKKDINKFKRMVHTVKKMTYTKKSLREHRDKLELIIENLDKIQNFIVDYAATHYALITYYEIAAYYYYIDEYHDDVVNLMTQQSEKLGLPDMQGRGLYKFSKKIDHDLRRLAIVFLQNPVSDDLIIKMNQLKLKITTLKSKIIISPVYKSQLSKTRWLKAFGVITVYGLMLVPIIICQELSLGGAMLIGAIGGIAAGNIIERL